MRNKLILNRLKIYTLSGKVAYNETFHKGVNIIRGANSSGKSTITHFIFYVLGGAFSNWTDEAKECSEVWAEVELNGVTVTIKRYLSENAKEAMFIYWGLMKDAMKVVEDGQWQKYPYNVSTNKKSFSVMMFENLDIPVVYGENNITMHQLLRLMYVDQDSPTNSLFYYEQFDSALTRQTSAELLLGVYDETLYQDRIQVKETEKKLLEVEGQIKGMKRLYDDPRNFDPIFLNTLIDNSQIEKNDIENEIILLKELKKKVAFRNDSKLNFEKLNSEMLGVRQKVNAFESIIHSLKLELYDSDFFIETLEKKKKAIKNSIITRRSLQNFPFEYCPECLSKLNATETNNCKLCKQEIDGKENSIIAKRMQLEISFQIDESRKLKEKRTEKLLLLKSRYESEKIKLKDLQLQVNSSLNDVRSYREEKIDELLIRKGEIEGLVLQYATMLEIAEKYSLMLDEIHEFRRKLKKLKETIEYKEKSHENLKTEINQKVELFALNLLKKDLNREEGFKEAKNLRINYEDNSIYIDDVKKKFSASSNFYLKNTARFSLFFASLEIPEMRYPRFILCDNMEDKGIEKERAQNFQKLIIETAKLYPTEDYQIIYTTSYISDEFEGSEYCVGDFYSEEANNKSLKNIN